jgi:IS30 family transposase
MARLLGRSASTVSRELKRNGGYDRYRAAPADEQAWVRLTLGNMRANGVRRMVRRARQFFHGTKRRRLNYTILAA